MKSLGEAGNRLQWIHPDVETKEWELRSGDQMMARLEWQPAMEAAGAVGRSAAGAWNFRQLGFLNPHVIVRAQEGREHVARFDATWGGGGLVEFANGRHFRWSSNLWRAEWGWLDSSGNHVIRFRRSFEVVEKNEGSVEIDPSMLASEATDVLVLLGWFLIILVAQTS